MKRFYIFLKKSISGIQLTLIAMVFIMAIAGNASAVVLDFEIGTPAGSAGQLSAGYGGFTWDSNWYVLTQEGYATYGNTTTFPSGNEAAFNRYGVLTVSTATGSSIDLNGAWFTGWASGNSTTTWTATSVTVDGYFGVTNVGSVSMALDPTQFLWLPINFGSPIDRFTVTSSGSSQWWLMDNLTYNERNQVTEPMTILLLGSGLAGIAVWRKRFGWKEG